LKHGLFLSFIVLACSVGCSSTDGGTSTGSGSTGGCRDYSKLSGTKSFKNDVMPIFQRACNFSSCHSSDATKGQEGLQLGKPSDAMGKPLPMTDPDIAKVHTGIVNRASSESSLVTVALGDPSKSWLAAKIEYIDMVKECPSVAATCKGSKGCGGLMPSGPDKLPAAEIDTIAIWIKDGAKNN
jgi:hypothetical protein